jgi:hypothetical protein
LPKLLGQSQLHEVLLARPLPAGSGEPEDRAALAALPATCAGPTEWTPWARRRWTSRPSWGWTRLRRRSGSDPGEHANLWFEGDALVVSFDNLATIDEGWPRAGHGLEAAGADGACGAGRAKPCEGLVPPAHRPGLLRGLEEQGFFRRFRRVADGASMGLCR